MRFSSCDAWLAQFKRRKGIARGVSERRPETGQTIHKDIVPNISSQQCQESVKEDCPSIKLESLPVSREEALAGLVAVRKFLLQQGNNSEEAFQVVDLLQNVCENTITANI